MTLPTFRSGSGVFGTGSQANVPATKPPGLAVDDIFGYMIELNSGGGFTLTPPANWNMYTISNATAGKSGRFVWKQATSADVAAASFTFTCTSVIWAYAGFALAGVDPLNPYETRLEEEDTGLNQSAPRPTTTRSDCIVVQALGAEDSLTSASSTQIQNIVRGSRGSAAALIGTIDAPNSGLAPNGTWNLSTSRSTGHLAIVFAGITATAHSQTPVDTLGLTDSRAAARQRTLVDLDGLTDPHTPSLAMPRQTIDPINLIDANVPTIGRTRQSTDLLGLTEPGSPRIDRIREMIDLLDFTDVYQPASVMARETLDQVAITDPEAWTQARLLTDMAGTTDGYLTSQGFALGFTDSLWAEDVVEPGFAGQLTRTLADLLGLVDTSARSYSRSFSTSLALSDPIVVDRHYSMDVQELLGATDAIDPTMSLSRGFVDPIGLTDLAGRQRLRPLRSTLALVDQPIANMGGASNDFRVVVTDPLRILDSRVIVKGLRRSVSDVLGIREAYYTVGGLVVVSRASRIVEVEVVPATELVPIYLDSAIDRRLALLEAVAARLEVD